MDSKMMSFKKFWHDEVTPEMLKSAQEELGETEEKKTQCLKELKELIKKEPDFYPCTEDGYLLRYLRARKFDVVKALKNLKNYYAYKGRYSGTITDLKPSNIKVLLEQCETTVLEYRDHDDVGVVIGRLGKYNLDNVPLDILLAAYIICFEVVLETELTQIVGYSLVLDFEDITLQTVRQISSPSLLYKFVLACQDVIPARIKAFHIVNEPTYISIFFKILRLFMSSKLYKRIHFHGHDRESLHKCIPAEILPEEYGGKQGPFKMSGRKYADRILSAEEFVAKRNEFGYRGKTLLKLRK